MTEILEQPVQTNKKVILNATNAKLRRAILRIVPTPNIAAYVLTLMSFGDGKQLFPNSRLRYRDYMIGGLPVAQQALQQLEQTTFMRKHTSRALAMTYWASYDLANELRELHQAGKLDAYYDSPVGPRVFRPSTN